MPTYNSLIDRANDAGALIPEEYEEQIFQALPEQSIVMQLGRRLRDMSRQERELRVMDGLIEAYFVGSSTAASGDSAKIQTSEASWGNKTIKAAKLGVIVPIPRDVVSDTSYDIWAEIRPLIAEALGRKFDAAVLYGTSAPSDWPTAIVTGANSAGNTASLAGFTDFYDAMLSEDGVVDKIEKNGYMVSGHVAHMSVRAKIRGSRGSTGVPIFNDDPTAAPRYYLDGNVIVFPRNGVIDSGSSLVVSGDWTQLVWAMRKGIDYELLTEATIVDDSNNVVISLAQQDCVALKATMRLGWELPTPPNRLDATPYPFGVLTA